MTDLDTGRVTVISVRDTIDQAIRKMAEKRSPEQIDGIAVAVDDDGKLLGVLTDGDIRRAYARGVDFFRPVSDVLVTDPVVVRSDDSPREILGHVSSQIAGKSRLKADMVRHVLAVDEHGRLDDVIDVAELLLRRSPLMENVAVYGLGYVGLTIAATLANLGHRVYGVDSNGDVRADIEKGTAHFHEPGLQDMLTLVQESNHLTTHELLDQKVCNVYVVAVGTPIAKDGSVDDSALLSVADSIGGILKKGDLVQLRSTVAIGCTRNRFLPRLLQHTSLEPGRDFHIAFTPERTVEGDALTELRSLPQIVGGYTQRCLEKAASFWSTVTNTIVHVDSLEAAELVKLANNTFRDISFSYANEIAEICGRFNLDAFRVIDAANEGYPRNTIPKPSPGVGGYCLTKDPLIYNNSAASCGVSTTLGYYGRAVNERAADHPKGVLNDWVEKSGRNAAELKILCIGMSFKGFPETGDLRGSIAIRFARWVAERAGRCLVWDAVAEPDELKAAGFSPSRDIREDLKEADAVFILNNNPAHTLLGIPILLNQFRKPRLVFDGWHQLDRNELEQIPQVTYATMGYITPEGS